MGPISRVGRQKRKVFVRRAQCTPKKPAKKQAGGRIDDACHVSSRSFRQWLPMGTFESTRLNARGRKKFSTRFRIETAPDWQRLLRSGRARVSASTFEIQANCKSGKKKESHLTGWVKIHTTNSEPSVHEALLGAGNFASDTSTRSSTRWPTFVAGRGNQAKPHASRISAMRLADRKRSCDGRARIGA